MDITISFRHINHDDGLKKYVEEKLSRLKKYVESPLDVHVVLSLERKYRQRVDVMFTLNGVVINAHEVQDDMRAAVDAIVDKLETRLSRYRDKVKQYREGKPKYATCRRRGANLQDHHAAEDRRKADGPGRSADAA